MSALRRRFDYANEMRRFAERLKAPGADAALIASEMRNRAAAVMKFDDPAERGEFKARDVFAPGRVVSAEKRNHVRCPGTISVKAG